MNGSRRYRRARPAPCQLATLLAILLPILLPAAADAGWHEVELSEPAGRALYYLPADAEGTAGGAPRAAVAFFHGAGSVPELYRVTVGKAAEAAGLVAVLPAAAGLGWGAPGDRHHLAQALDRVGRQVALDPSRTALAGHSAGGAWAYLLAYGEGWPASAVFAAGAPFYPVTGAPPEPVPPIRLLYGALDPNYTGGARDALVTQWQALGVPWEEDVRPGYGHNGWPQEALDAGFAFLAAARRPGGCASSDSGGTTLCLHAGAYRARVEWRDGRGGAGPGRVVEGVSSDTSGLFWFFRPDNWELLVKVLDGCPVNGHRWVFVAAVTNLSYDLTVREEESGSEWSVSNPPGRPAPAVTDTTAFPCS